MVYTCLAKKQDPISKISRGKRPFECLLHICEADISIPRAMKKRKKF
jgi:hypothetical protein